MKKPFISKSAFIKGLQCHKALYLKKHYPELEDPVSEAQQAIFDAGTDIGQLATGLFPGGVDLGHYIPKQMFDNVRVTRDHIHQRDTIYEAGFSQDSLLCFMDILVPDGDRWKAYEVKGSTSVKEVYLWDAAFQYYVMRQSGVRYRTALFRPLSMQFPGPLLEEHTGIQCIQHLTVETGQEV
ncbi:MAG: hypothetical protein P8100_15290 [bacterium]